MYDIFTDYAFGQAERAQMDADGHHVLPGILTPPARADLTGALARIDQLRGELDDLPNRYAAEYDTYLASLIAHPQLVGLARAILGDDVRYDHCVTLNRSGGNGGIGWHSHSYGEERPELGFVRIFFYVNGFTKDDGGLKVICGSHLLRDHKLHGPADDDVRESWMRGKTNPNTGEEFAIEGLDAPAGSVVVMWTHAAHAVTPRQPGSDTRWCVVYAYRNPGRSSAARWITEQFEQSPPSGAEALLPLY
jgi:hypothetical protein